MHIGKLDGKISSPFFKEMPGKSRDEQRRQQRDIERQKAVGEVAR